MAQVVSVQEFVKKPVNTVPDTYIRLGEEPENKSNGFSPSVDVPIIDMEKLSMDESVNNPEVQKLHSACKEMGVFQLINHGIETSFLEKVNYESEAFFNLPPEEKRKYEIKPGEFEGYGNLVKVGAKLDWGDRFFMTMNPKERVKPHLFPELPSSMRETLQAFKDKWEKITMELLKLFSISLGLDADKMQEMFHDGYRTLRMAYYPPCPQPELVVGLTPHTDVTATTFLHQVNGVDGFEIKKNGAWKLVHVLPGAILINLGDIFEILTNGYYKSMEHRVSVNPVKERISLAMAFNPKMEEYIRPLPPLTTPENPPLFKTIKMEEYIDGFFSHKLYGRSYIELMKIKK